jgi:hypothetical protein
MLTSRKARSSGGIKKGLRIPCPWNLITWIGIPNSQDFQYRENLLRRGRVEGRGGEGRGLLKLLDRVCLRDSSAQLS